MKDYPIRNTVMPVVVVGKNRTRMTCEVIRNIQKHIVGKSPYFIIVSDRSREGHKGAISDFCQKNVSGEWVYLETTSSRFGWGAAINMGLEEAWKFSDAALVVDNDWILQQDLDVRDFSECLADSGIGCVSFKQINAGTNIDLEEYRYFDDIYLVRNEKDDSQRPSYVVEIGCMIVSQRFHEEVGRFLENENKTDEVEWDFMRRYENILPKVREQRRVLFATPQKYLHSQLNGEGHVFTHVGIESQSGRRQTWGCPEEYVDLNDIKKDEDFCHRFKKSIRVALVAIAKDEDRYIDEWIAYHLKLGFDDIFVYQNDWRYGGSEYLNHPKVHWLESDGSCQQSASYNKFIEEHRNDYDFVAFFDIDEFLWIKNEKSVEEFLSGYKDVPGIALNWRLFGDNDLSELKDGEDASQLKRFTKCAKDLCASVKIIVNLKKLPEDVCFHYAHQMFRGESEFGFCDPAHLFTSSKGRIENNSIDEPAELYHFRNKTFQENLERHFGKGNPNESFVPDGHKTEESLRRLFDEYNENDVENTQARDFLYEKFPVVIVGKERTKIVKEVIKSIICHFKYCAPHIVLSDDSSSSEHVEKMKAFLSECGVEYDIVSTDENRHGLGAANNNGINLAFLMSDVLYIGENDYIFEKDINIAEYATILRRNACVFSIGFKWLCKNSNVAIKYISIDGHDFIAERPQDCSKQSFCFDLGSRILHRRMWSKFGGYKENCPPPDVERDAEWKYLHIPDVYSGNAFSFLDVKFLCFNYNGNESPIKHIGLISQKDGGVWGGIPDKYRYLSESEDTKIDWRKYFDRIYVFHHLPHTERVRRLQSELKRVGILDSGILEMRNTSPTRYDEILLKALGHEDWKSSVANYGLETIRVLSEAVHFQYSRILMLEDDVVFLKDISEVKRHLDMIPEGYGIIQWDKFIDPTKPNEENDYIDSHKINEYYSDAGNHAFLSTGAIILNRDGILDYHSFMEGSLRHNDSFYLTTKCRRAVAIHNPCIQLMFSTAGNLKLGPQSYIDSSYKFQGVTMGDYAVPIGYDLGKTYDEFVEKDAGQRFGITDTDFTEKEMPIIEWSKYFDKIYCFHSILQDNRIERLKEELSRVNILDSGIFEWRYTSPNPYDDIIFEHQRGPLCQMKFIVNYGLATLNVFNEAEHYGYKKILLLENDIAFLKDKREIIALLDDMPECDIIQLDKFVRPGKIDYASFTESHSISNGFFEPGEEIFTSASCLVLNHKGISEFKRIMSEHLRPNDTVWQYSNCNRAIAKKNMTVQLNYDGCGNLQLGNLTYMDKCYKEQGIDFKYYNVPDGYDYGETVESSARERNMIGSKCKGRKKVSVYAITKNESHLVEKWMSSMSEADEVVVLDTGSTDDTVEHLRKLGARVEVEKFEKWNSVAEYDAIVKRGGNPWRFDKARNDSMALVSEDADILVTTDIDEFIQPGWRKRLEDQWIAAEERGERPNCAGYKYVWCYNPDGTEARTFEVHKIHRRGVCTWTHMIHEVLSYKEGDKPVHLNDFTVEHHQDLSKSRTSYLPMLEVSARDNPDNDRDAHYYGRELMYAGRWDEAIAELKRHLSLRSAGWWAERAASMRYIANCYKQKGEDELWELWMLKAMEEDPNHREASFNLGLHYMGKKDYHMAEKVLGRCLSIPTNTQEYICDGRCWTAKPLILMSQAKWWNGDWAGAEATVRRATELYPEDVEAQKQLEGMSSTRKKYNR